MATPIKEATPVEEKKVDIVLDRPFITNGKTLSGKVSVPEAVAEDLLRRQAEAQAADRALMQKHEAHIKVDEISVGGA